MNNWRTIESAPSDGQFDLWAEGRRVPNAERSANGGFRVWHRFQRDKMQASRKTVTGVRHYRQVNGATHWKPVDAGPYDASGLHIEIHVQGDGNTSAHFSGGVGMNADRALQEAITALEAERRELAACPYHATPITPVAWEEKA
jgi:hypothetical protein